MNFYDSHGLTVVFSHLWKRLNGLCFNALKTCCCYLCGTTGTSLLLLFLPQRGKWDTACQGYWEQRWLVKDGGDARWTEAAWPSFTLCLLYTCAVVWLWWFQLKKKTNRQGQFCPQILPERQGKSAIALHIYLHYISSATAPHLNDLMDLV